MLLQLAGEMQRVDDGEWLCVFWPSCVCFTENDLIALFCESYGMKPWPLEKYLDLNEGGIGSKNRDDWR